MHGTVIDHIRNHITTMVDEAGAKQWFFLTVDEGDVCSHYKLILLITVWSV